MPHRLQPSSRPIRKPGGSRGKKTKAVKISRQKPVPARSDTKSPQESFNRIIMRHYNGIAYQVDVRNGEPSDGCFMKGAVKTITGYRTDDFLEGRLRWSDLIPSRHLARLRRFRKKLIKNPGRIRILEYPVRRSDGSLQWVADHAAAFVSGRASVIQGLLNDVTERKRVENRILHLNAVLAGKRSVNRLITHEKRAERLLKKACGLLTQNRGYPHVWVALKGPDAKSAAFFESGFPAGQSKLAASIRNGELPLSARRALRQADPVIHKIPDDRQPALASSLWGGLIVRLDHGKQVFGLMGVTVPLALVRKKEEHALLKEVAGDLGFALHGFALEEKRRRAEQLLAEREKMLALIYDNVFDGISIYEEFTAENRRKLIDCNQRYCDISGRSREELLRIGDTRTIQNNLSKEYTARRDFIQDLKGRPVYQGHFSWIRPDGKENTVEYVAALVEREGRLFVVGIDRDVTERRRNEEMLEASLREKEILLREVHHRVKNNLQIIVSLLNLQADHADDPRLADAFKDSKNRIYMMALVHETLYRSDNFTNISFNKYIMNMMEHVLRFHPASSSVDVDFNLENVSLGLGAAIPCALILNELVTNSLKHAFKDRQQGRIQICLKRIENGGIQLGVSDDGSGLPEQIDVNDSPTMGLSLVRMLTAQLSGKLRVKRDNGTSFLIRFTA